MAYSPTIIQGSKDVTTAGTREQLITVATSVRTVIIQSKRANTDNIFVGDSNISSTTGISIAPGDSISFDPPKDKHGTNSLFDLSDFWLDSAVNGEGVTFIYTTDGQNVDSM